MYRGSGETMVVSRGAGNVGGKRTATKKKPCTFVRSFVNMRRNGTIPSGFGIPVLGALGL